MNHIPRLETIWGQCECNNARWVADKNCPKCDGRGIVPVGKHLECVAGTLEREDFDIDRVPMGNERAW